MKRFTFRGLDSAAHLYDWLIARGQKNVVVCIADVMRLPINHQLEFIRILAWWDGREVGRAEDELAVNRQKLRQAIQHLGFRGHIVLPVEPLAKMELARLEEIQGWLMLYIESRRSRGKPTFREECCDKNDCSHCGGTGYVNVLGEITPVERALAEGHDWDYIDKENLDG
jgi:hypothetical protein